jgi:hypothetical protein
MNASGRALSLSSGRRRGSSSIMKSKKARTRGRDLVLLHKVLAFTWANRRIAFPLVPVSAFSRSPRE